MKHDRHGFFSDTRNLSLEDLQGLASRRIVRRGLDYARTGRVTNLIAGPTRLEARVVGTGSEPYLLELEHDGEEILCSCSCPFDWEPFCKHAIAVLAVHFGLGVTAAATSATAADGDETAPSLEEQECTVRQRRAARGGFKISRLEGDPFFGIFTVLSPSGKDYQVEIRSLAQPVNRCSCLDHATSMLGTCKHIEAVLAAQRKRAKRKFARLAAGPPTVAQVLADLHDTPRIRLILPAHPTPALKTLAAEFFDAAGYFLGDPVDDFARFLVSARRLRKTVIYSDAIELSERIAAERRVRRRSEEVRRTVLTNGSRIPGFRGELYPFQVEGAAFLAATGRGLLGDDMGLGKTVQAIAATQVLWERGEVRRALIICPASLKSQWAEEIQRFSGLDCRIISGFPATRLAQYRERMPFTIANYELALRDSKGISELAPDLIILDEAQRIRNWRTMTAEAIKKIEARFAFVLTGTPLQNRLDDLYSIMQVVDRRVLGPLWAYNEQFVVKEEGKSRILGYRNLDELRRRLAPVLLRRNKDEVKLQLPERIDSRFGVGMTADQRNFMDEGVATAAMYAAIAEKRPLTPKELESLFSAMQMARMACNAAGLVDKETKGSPKLDELDQLLRDLCLEEGRKVVVFSEWEIFSRMAAEKAKRLGISFVRLHGGVPTPKRGDLIARFRDDDACKIFFSTDAGGVGLNLQFASSVINMELPWNPAVLDQRIGRVHRHGQTDPVHVFLLVAEESFESGLEATLATKRAVFHAALDRTAKETTVDATSSCLAFVRSALEAMEPAGGSEVAPGPEAKASVGAPAGAGAEATPDATEDAGAGAEIEGAVPAAASIAEVSGSTPAKPEEQRIAESARKLEELLGPRLARVLVLPSGRAVAVVDRADAASKAAAHGQGMAIAEIGVVEGLAALEEDSPFSSARVILDRTTTAGDQQGAQRRQWLTVARRKLAAAEALAASSLGAEAIAQAHACMIAAVRSLVTDQDAVADLPPARLVYEILVPRGALDLEKAALISRAEGLATAYADVAQSVEPSTARTVITDAQALFEDALREAGSPSLLAEESGGQG